MKGHNGIFDVSVGGQLLFSKNRDHGFPTEADVVAKLKSLAK